MHATRDNNNSWVVRMMDEKDVEYEGIHKWAREHEFSLTTDKPVKCQIEGYHCTFSRSVKTNPVVTGVTVMRELHLIVIAIELRGQLC